MAVLKVEIAIRKRPSYLGIPFQKRVAFFVVVHVSQSFMRSRFFDQCFNLFSISSDFTLLAMMPLRYLLRVVSAVV